MEGKYNGGEKKNGEDGFYSFLFTFLVSGAKVLVALDYGGKNDFILLGNWFPGVECDI